jgi:NAD(P)-dependent dehydrogenase (short-subunit alcohol dehydrogenase family)
MLVENKVAVITGGASGIGRATAERYAAEGASVVVADVDEERGERTVTEITDVGGEATFVPTDVSQAADVREMITTAVSEYGDLDVLFNNAGIEGPLDWFENYDDDAFDRVVATNLRGVFFGTKYGIDAMLNSGGGAIINTSSIVSRSGVRGRSGYAGTKAGINGLTRTAAVEYADKSIRVNSVLPGIVETPMVRRSVADDSNVRDGYDLSEPMPGKTQPEEVANAVLFLGSSLASRITGIELPVDGGFLQQP